MNKKLLITGGAGFIGSAVIRHIIDNTNHSVVNVDKLTYAGNLESLVSVENDSRYAFEQVDICDAKEGKVIAYKFQGTRFDCGSVKGHLMANITFAKAAGMI